MFRHYFFMSPVYKNNGMSIFRSCDVSVELDRGVGGWS